MYRNKYSKREADIPPITGIPSQPVIEVTTGENTIASRAMSFVKDSLHLLLRYVALTILLIYHTGEKIVLAIITPLQPITAEAKKVPKSEITLHGILRTFMRFIFLAGLYWWTAASSFVRYLFRPVEALIESAKNVVGNEAGSPSVWGKAQ